MVQRFSTGQVFTIIMTQCLYYFITTEADPGIFDKGDPDASTRENV